MNIIIKHSEIGGEIIIQPNKQLYLFLTACGGNWRRTIYVPSPEEGCSAHLLAFNRDGKPVTMPVDRLQKLSEEQIDPAECCGQLVRGGFQDLFAQYLIWQTASTPDQTPECLG